MPLNRPAVLFSPRLITAGFAVATILWLVLLVGSPYLVSHATPGSVPFTAGGLVYMAGSVVCHQRADRSFHAWGVQLPVCGRCVGLYAGAVLGSVLAAFSLASAASGFRRIGAVLRSSFDSGTPTRPLRRGLRPPGMHGATTPGSSGRPDWLLRFTLAGFPTAASVGLEMLGFWPQSPAIRCVAALPLGFAVAWFVGVHAADLAGTTRARSRP
jgi:hypothetical protein